MKRREFLEGATAVAGMGLLSGACSPPPQPEPAGIAAPAQLAAPTSLVVKFLGLNAFINDTVNDRFDVALVHADGVPLPWGSETVHPHSAVLAIAKSAFVKQSNGQAPVALDRTRLSETPGNWFLESRLSTTEFYHWSLKQSHLTFGGLAGDSITGRLSGALPLGEMTNQNKLKSDWRTNAAVVDAVVRIDTGLIREGRPRRFPGSDAQNKWWTITDDGGNPPNGFKRQLADIVDYEARAAGEATLTLTDGYGTGANTNTITVSGNAEILVVHLSEMMSVNERKFWYQMHHTRAFYLLYDKETLATLKANLAKRPIARTINSTGLEADPVYCTPGTDEI